jgi:hypothetical protein
LKRKRKAPLRIQKVKMVLEITTLNFTNDHKNSILI